MFFNLVLCKDPESCWSQQLLLSPALHAVGTAAGIARLPLVAALLPHTREGNSFWPLDHRLGHAGLLMFILKKMFNMHVHTLHTHKKHLGK